MCQIYQAYVYLPHFVAQLSAIFGIIFKENILMNPSSMEPDFDVRR